MRKAFLNIAQNSEAIGYFYFISCMTQDTIWKDNKLGKNIHNTYGKGLTSLIIKTYVEQLERKSNPVEKIDKGHKPAIHKSCIH